MYAELALGNIWNSEKSTVLPVFGAVGKSPKRKNRQFEHSDDR